MIFSTEKGSSTNNTNWNLHNVNNYYSQNTPKNLSKKVIIPRNILGCDMRFPEKEENSKDIEKVKKLYNKLESIKLLENHRISIEDKLHFIKMNSIIESNKSIQYHDIDQSIDLKLNRTYEITEDWWVYDW